MTGYDIQKSTDEVDPIWDDFVQSTEGGWYHQTSLWGKLKQTRGWKTIRLVVYKQGKIIAGVQILIRTFPKFFPATIGIVPKGPVIHPDHLEPELLRVIFTEFENIIYENRIFFFALQPPNHENFYSDIYKEFRYKPSPQENIYPPCDVLIDLEGSLDSILNNMRKSTRHNIFLSHDFCICVREGSLTDLSCFCQILSLSGQRKQYLADDDHYIHTLYQLFKEKGWITLLLAEYEKTPLAAMILITFRDTVIPWRLGCTGCGLCLHPNEAVYWEAIRWAKSHGYRFFSIGGVSSAIAKSNLSEAVLVKEQCDSITSFKLGFGGHITVYPGTYDCIHNPLFAWSYHKVYPIFENGLLMKYIFSMISRR